jgi:tetratricopeptide (TPR) repeat protein
LLDALVGVHLIEESARGRYAFHALLREYGRERARHDEPEAEARAAIGRLLTWYLRSADAAAEHLPQRHRADAAGRGAGITPLSFTGQDDALAWCEAERTNFTAVITQAAELGEHEIQWKLPLELGSFYNLRKYWSDWISSYRVGLSGAETVGEVAAQGWLLTSLGTALRDTGQLDEAAKCQRRAADCFERTGELVGLASARNNRGAVLHALGDLVGAVDEYELAVETHRAAASLHGEARALSNQATVLTDLGRSNEAIEQLRRAIALFAQTSDRHGEGFTQHNLGDALTAAGQPEAALAAYAASLVLRRATGNVWGEARTLASLGACHRALGDRTQAIEHLTTAIACYGHACDVRGQAQVQQLLDEIAAENEE